jgi:hypothetical protein
MEKKPKSKQKAWNNDDKWAFTHSRLRAQTLPDKKKEQDRKACRNREAQK